MSLFTENTVPTIKACAVPVLGHEGVCISSMVWQWNKDLFHHGDHYHARVL